MSYFDNTGKEVTQAEFDTMVTGGTNFTVKGADYHQLSQLEEDELSARISNRDSIIVAETNNARRKEILSRLNEIDIDSVRALRAMSIGKGGQPDTDKLNALETEAEALRIELAALIIV